MNRKRISVYKVAELLRWNVSDVRQHMDRAIRTLEQRQKLQVGSLQYALKYFQVTTKTGNVFTVPAEDRGQVLWKYRKEQPKVRELI